MNVLAHKKNWIDKDKIQYQKNINSTTFAYDTSTILCSIIIDCSQNQIFTINGDNLEILIRYRLLDNTSTSTVWLGKVATITTPVNCIKMGILFRKVGYVAFTDISELTNNNIQLELGTVATSYEPYTGAEYPITLPDGFVGGSLPNGVKDTDTMQYMKSITFSGQSVTIPDMKSNGSFWSTRGGTLVDKTITLASVPSGTTTIDYELETPIPITLALPLINTYDKYTKIECTNAVKPVMTVKYLEK